MNSTVGTLVGAFRATYLSMGTLSAMAAGIFFQLGRAEGPVGPTRVVNEA